MAMGTIKINGIPFLSMTTRALSCRTLQPLTSQTNESHRSAIDDVLRICNGANFIVKSIHCDRECESLFDPIADDMGIDMICAPAQAHVPKVERSNRVIKERVRSVFHRLPFRAIPSVVIRFLVMDSTNELNCFPQKGGMSPHFSPRTILTGKKLDHKKHCSIPFGTHVQAQTEPKVKNSMDARTIDGIHLPESVQPQVAEFSVGV